MKIYTISKSRTPFEGPKLQFKVDWIFQRSETPIQSRLDISKTQNSILRSNRHSILKAKLYSKSADGFLEEISKIEF
ncbi:hypothetical protein RclHR1_22460001 [Rhizophagus clarus]|uniref:Uncharacterized protein n=1 Tax=Rhizophagus clarus TaxID=94130 RepID=A0A2Z6R7V4_9GLOM|nr:hypothetical protein RclHR1_22460001 [Rhizophagus clarus]